MRSLVFGGMIARRAHLVLAVGLLVVAACSGEPDRNAVSASGERVTATRQNRAPAGDARVQVARSGTKQVVVAIPCNGKVAEFSLAFLAARGRDCPNVLWESSDKLQITVALLDDVPAERIDELTARVQRVAVRSEPFVQKVGGISASPNKENPTVIMVGLPFSGNNPLRKLREDIQQELDRAGFRAGRHEASVNVVIGQPARGRFTTADWQTITRTGSGDWGEIRVVALQILENRGGRDYPLAEVPLGKLAE